MDTILISINCQLQYHSDCSPQPGQKLSISVACCRGGCFPSCCCVSRGYCGSQVGLAVSLSALASPEGIASNCPLCQQPEVDHKYTASIRRCLVRLPRGKAQREE